MRGKKIFERAVLGLGVAGLLAATSACGGGGGASAGDDESVLKTPEVEQPTPTPAPEFVITISDNKFEPAEARVKAGTKVTWKWSGSNPHSVVQGGQDSGQMTGSGSYSLVTRSPITINYQCGVHKEAMTGKIVVE